MAALTGLFLRGSTYYIRVVLPLHHPLKHKYKNEAFVASLGCSSYREAALRGTIKRAEDSHMAVLCGGKARCLC